MASPHKQTIIFVVGGMRRHPTCCSNQSSNEPKGKLDVCLEEYTNGVHVYGLGLTLGVKYRMPTYTCGNVVIEKQRKELVDKV
jgi:hypothetical protein